MSKSQGPTKQRLTPPTPPANSSESKSNSSSIPSATTESLSSQSPSSLASSSSFSWSAFPGSLSRLSVESLAKLPLYHHFLRLYTWFRTLPIVDFYTYIYRINKPLFFGTLFTNYLLPLVLEFMPWFLSRTQLNRMIRDLRNTLEHRAITSKSFQLPAVINFIVLNIIFIIIHTLEQLVNISHYTNRLSLYCLFISFSFCGVRYISVWL